MNATNRINGVDDIENGQLGCVSGKREAAVLAALREYESGAIQGLHHFDQIVGRELRGSGNVLRGLGSIRVLGEDDDSTEGVLDGLGEHAEDSISR